MLTQPREIKIEPRPHLMVNSIQNYAWGTRGKDAFIPNFIGETAEGDKPYAELWMGAHPSAPSKLFIDNSYVPLDQLISLYPEKLLGHDVAKSFSQKLPFLFKVLSAREALSIQAHPNKKQAIELHQQYPEHYPDDNHKPEVAIALTSLTALVGFKTPTELTGVFKIYPEISTYIGKNLVDKFDDSVRLTDVQQRMLVQQMYSTLIHKSLTDEQALSESIHRLDIRFKRSNLPLTQQETLFLSLKNQYGNDVGLLSLFVLNLIHLTEGQGIFLYAGIPHAYIAGNIVECMANSDNVVRAGLTPKYKDVKTLLKILNYDTSQIPILTKNSNKKIIDYNTPAAEFCVSCWDFIKDESRVQDTKGGPEILLVTDGDMVFKWRYHGNVQKAIYHKGQSIFIPACLKQYEIGVTNKLKLYRVSVPLF